ncbi:ribosomal L1 domain-containing protein CG13096-like [Chenopodium quinoa]|uniref:ribosomal L1 domain-containing protein CG13096-like n=1 Tax=Chenopodium quinoa TaxID=63459 RepID=UPI000B788B14|nr:ribosomal L1 domain-containing protein CG13096-like [Chenopodium quinoa]
MANNGSSGDGDYDSFRARLLQMHNELAKLTAERSRKLHELLVLSKKLSQIRSQRIGEIYRDVDQMVPRGTFLGVGNEGPSEMRNAARGVNLMGRDAGEEHAEVLEDVEMMQAKNEPDDEDDDEDDEDGDEDDEDDDGEDGEEEEAEHGEDGKDDDDVEESSSSEGGGGGI